ncbi:MAG: transcription antitermination factor NusB [Chthoniobacterales bacterium]|nr:transcription antitermination factor NusB [Chthoniobacterales bacterium]
MSGSSGHAENRRQARIQAVQQLYGREMRGALAAPDGQEEEPGGDEENPFTRELVVVTTERLAQIDGLLTGALQNWDLRRLGAVDRAVLRVAVAELLSCQDIPAAVTINEAIEIARTLASSDSARFANGVLDRVRKEIGRDPRAKG